MLMYSKNRESNPISPDRKAGREGEGEKNGNNEKPEIAVSTEQWTLGIV